MITTFEDIERQRCEHCRDCAGCCRDGTRAQAPSGLRVALLLVALAILAGVGAGAAMPAWASAAAPAAAGLPGDSLYRVEAQLTDQSGHAFAFAERAGHVQLATMFYATCPYVCPMIVDQLKAIERQLTDAERDRLRVLLITLEAEKDTPEVLAEVASKRRIDTRRWTLARPQPTDVRKLSAVLGVQYRKLPDGEFNHSSVISLLDREGRIVAQTSKLGGEPDAAFVEAIRKALAD